MARIEWAMWANENAVIACATLFVGGLLAVCSLADVEHVRWEVGAYGMAIALIIFFLEYPRGKRTRGNTRQRSMQHIPTNFVASMGFFGRNYFVRFILYFLCAVPTVFNLGTVTGGISLLITSIIYLRAAISGESWQPCEKQVTREKTLTRARPPSMAPPRMAANAKKNAAYAPGDDENENYQNSGSVVKS
ncbi:cytochrome b-245 light chain-like [Clytia hemisphaerica]|uniref:Cytochrome b-245 light chain n=1 Tax=Clytia hemisphaerica TaxID=252671 RepID=A0A7M5XCE8_9CNID|eukprot:TCONS_00060994-protein